MITVSQALKNYYLNRKGSIAAPERLEYAIHSLNEHLGNLDLSEIDVIVCKRYTELRNVAPATIARELGVLKAAANHALKWKHIKMDQMPTFDIPKNLPKREIWLFKDEYAQLMDYVNAWFPEKLGVFIKMLYHTASRRKAIETLEWSQIDFINGRIHLDKPGAMKTKKRRPVVPMNGLRQDLETLFRTKTNSYVLGSGHERYYEFMTALAKADLLEVKERDGRPAGRVTPHTLRHSRATHLLESGVSIYTVAQLLGDNPTTVERVYAHACTSSLEKALLLADA